MNDTFVSKIPSKYLHKNYRLCYVDRDIMYFTDDFQNAYGDSWDADKYQDNAGEPYEYDESLSPEENHQQGRSHIIYIGFKAD